MKRTLALFLALMMALSLCACGGGDSTTETLVSTDWKAVLDYPNPYSLSFNEDGTGSLSDSSGHVSEITWVAQDNIVEMEREGSTPAGASTTYKYTLQLVAANDSYRLVEDNEADGAPRFWTFVPEDKFEAETEALKAERLEEAQDLSLSSAEDLRDSNQAKFEAEYVGKPWKFTGCVESISKDSCSIGNTGYPYSDVTAYMSEDDLLNLNVGETITVVGLITHSVSTFNMELYRAFIV